MAETTRFVPMADTDVWALLADGRKYADWVVGAKRVRAVDPEWPAVGSKFHHTVGVWPFHLRDNTAVLECDEGRRLVLEARLRPLGRAQIEMILRPSDGGTAVVMREWPSSPALARMAAPVFEPAIHLRNVEALRRLESALSRGHRNDLVI